MGLCSPEGYPQLLRGHKGEPRKDGREKRPEGEYNPIFCTFKPQVYPQNACGKNYHNPDVLATTAASNRT